MTSGCRIFLVFCALAVADTNSIARPPYALIVDSINAETDAELQIQQATRKDMCAVCHQRRNRSQYAQAFLLGLGENDARRFVYDPQFWARGDDGDYRKEAVARVRAAIRRAAIAAPWRRVQEDCWSGVRAEINAARNTHRTART